METLAQAIERAAAALGDADYETALGAAIGAWRTCRAPELETLIETISAHAARARPIIDSADEDWQSDWLERARQRRLVDIPALLPLAAASPKGEIPRRIRLLLNYGPDPRVGRLLVEMILEPPTTASANFSMWSDLFHSLPDYIDRRDHARLSARAQSAAGASQFWLKLNRWIASVLPALPEPETLTEPHRSALTDIQSAAEALLAGPAPELQEQSSRADAPGWPMPESLRSALDHLNENRLPESLDAMVWFWSSRRAPALAEEIDRLGRMVDSGQPILAASSKKAFHQAWMEVGDLPRPTAVGRLLETMRSGTLTQVEARLDAMLRWSPDPRVARAMLKLIKDHTLSARTRMWTAVYDALVHHADVRVLGEFRERADNLRARDTKRRQSEGLQLDRTADDFEAACAEDATLGSVDDERLQEISRQLEELRDARLDSDSAARVEQRLVAAIVADYEANSPRLVYADWLQQRGDPRGEFIALDIELANGKRVKVKRDRYYKTHRDEILGPIGELVGLGARFERGLLHSARVTMTRGGLDVASDERDKIIRDTRWATLRECHLFSADRVGAFLAEAPLMSLHRLEGVIIGDFLALGRRAKPIPLRFVRLHVDEDLWDELGRLTRVLPDLREMAIRTDRGGLRSERGTPPLAFFRSPLVRRLHKLRNGDAATSGTAPLDEWLRRMSAAKCPVGHLEMIGPQLSANAYLDPRGDGDQAYSVHLHIAELRASDEPARIAVADVLRGLPAELISSVAVEFVNVDRPVEVTLQHALKHLPVELPADVQS